MKSIFFFFFARTASWCMWNFSTSMVKHFSPKYSETFGFYPFSHISKTSLNKMSDGFFFLSQFYVNFSAESFSVHTCQSKLALCGQTTKRYRFIELSIGWSKTMYVRSSCWSNQIRLKTLAVIQLSLMQGGDRRLFTCCELEYGK